MCRKARQTLIVVVSSSVYERWVKKACHRLRDPASWPPLATGWREFTQPCSYLLYAQGSPRFPWICLKTFMSEVWSFDIQDKITNLKCSKTCCHTLHPASSPPFVWGGKENGNRTIACRLLRRPRSHFPFSVALTLRGGQSILFNNASN